MAGVNSWSLARNDEVWVRLWRLFGRLPGGVLSNPYVVSFAKNGISSIHKPPSYNKVWPRRSVP